jgi:hypothetical protein
MQPVLRALVFCSDRQLALDAADALGNVCVESLLVASEHACLDRLRYEPWDVCVVDDVGIRRELRQRLSEEEIAVPLLAVNAHHDPETFSVALGVDALELGSKQQAIPRGVTIETGDLTISPAELDARVHGQPLRLMRREFQILYLLALAGGRRVTVAELARRLDLPDTDWWHVRKNVTAQIVRLRGKLRAASSSVVISNRRAHGWALEDSLPASTRPTGAAPLSRRS